ncbi:MAG: UPF0182 family protein [Candidatus Woesearchaeota archaeon]
MDPKKARSIAQGVLISLIILIFIFSSRLVVMITDYMWFKSLSIESVFLTELKAKILLFAIAAGASFIFLGINFLISTKINKSENFISGKIKIFLALGIAIIAGLIFSSQWMTTLQYMNQSSFNLTEPVFNRDVSFYIFSLPFYNAALNFIFGLLLVTGVIVALDYLQSILKNIFKPQYTQDPSSMPSYSFNIKALKIKKKPLTHLTILGALFFILLAVRHYLTRFSIMYSEKGIVVGAGYTDVMVTLPIFKIMMILALVVTVTFFLYLFIISKQPKLKKRHILLYITGLYVVFGFLGPTVVPEFFQSLRVSPNEINLEKPYIENNIEFTRIAYGLDDVSEIDVPVYNNLSMDLLEQESETVKNIRILDRRPLRETYKQTQEIRLYYDLSGIDIDRYYINGNYTSVLLAPRELDQNQITENAKTWVNLHLVYTHGFGIVMSPVNKVTDQGLPDHLIKDIPPKYSVEDESINIIEPRVYYGEKDNQYIIVNTGTREFDYPKGNENEYIHYDGFGGINLDTFGKKILMALRFGDIKLLLSSDIKPESRIKFTRNILSRARKITPFFGFDSDPYIVISEGRLKWIIDAYTVSNYFPYSEKYGNINYIRNPVKIVLDAYNGDINYYVIEPEEPIIQTLDKIYPELFSDYEDMPESLKDHVRYPKDLFKIQSKIYQTYHMTDPTVFYNKEDAWETPTEIYGVGQEVEVDPYHIIMKLPGEDKEEFILMSTFTPIRKNNMISWIAARSDGEDYGKLLVYRFPKDKLVYGPLQIEAKFDQDSEISQQLTLWSQQGSRVTRGNLIIIPIENNILYVEPLYIQAETGQLPELKRVLVSDGERVVMEETLGKAFVALFGGELPDEIDDNDEDQDGLNNQELIEQANDYYDMILDAMRNNDWGNIGVNFDRLGNILGRLGNQQENSTS